MRRSTRRPNSAATARSCSIRPRRIERAGSGSGRAGRTALRAPGATASSGRWASGSRGWRRHRAITRIGRGRVAAASRSRRQVSIESRRAGRSRRPPPRSAGRPSTAGHQRSAFGAAAGSCRNSLDEPPLALVVHRLADDPAGGREGQVGDLAAQLGDGPLLLRLDLGGRPAAQPLELLAGRGDLRSRVSSATFWARSRISFASRRASERGLPLRLGRLLAVAPRLLRVLEALLDPGPAVVEHRRDPAWNAKLRKITKNTTKLGAATMIQNRLIWNWPPRPPQPPARAPLPDAGPATASRSTMVSARPGRRTLDEDGQQADDDREDAEAFGERREDDRQAADLRRRRRGCARSPRRRGRRGCRCRCPGR